LYPSTVDYIILEYKKYKYPSDVSLYYVQSLMQIIEPDNGLNILHYYELFDLKN